MGRLRAHHEGNYGNLLFCWDVLFGTAHITRHYPGAYELENLPDESWRTELAWPLVPMAKAVASPPSAEDTVEEGERPTPLVLA